MIAKRLSYRGRPRRLPVLHQPAYVHAPTAACPGDGFVCQCVPEPRAHDELMELEAAVQHLEHRQGRCTAPGCKGRA